MEDQRKRLAYVDVLNVAAAFSVVILHCNGCFWAGPSQGASWFSANCIETLFYWPVPVFFMLSGTTLMNYRDRMSTEDYLKRRIPRTFIPFVLWSLIGLAWHLAWGETLDLSPLALLDGILNCRYVSIYWFFLPLFAAYLSIPLLSLAKDDTRLLVFLAAVGTLTTFTLPLVCKLIGIQWNSALTPPVVSGEQGFMAYLLFGWLISRYNIPKRYRPLVYVLGICGWLTHMLGTLAVSTPEDGVNGLFKQYNNLPALLQAVALFTFVRNVSFDHGPAQRIASICKQLTPLTLGVYLEHWYLIDLVSRLGLASPFSLKWRLVGPLLIFAACCACTWLLRRFRLTKHLVP